MSSPAKSFPLLLLLDIGLIAWGVWRLTREGEHGRWNTTWSFVLIGVGTLGIVFRLLGRAVGGGKTPEQAADAILGQQKRVYSGEPHEYRAVSLAEFPRADVGFYDRTRDLLAGAGFRCLGDWENVTLTREFPNMRAALRTFVGDGGTVLAAAYHVRPAGWMRALALVGVLPKEIRTVEFETEFDNGTYVATANSREVDPTMPIPGIWANKLPGATDPLEVLRQHREAVRHVTAADPARRPTVCTSIEDVKQVQHRMHALKSAYRKQVGYTTPEELSSIQGRPLTGAEWQVAAAIERAKTQPPAGAADPPAGPRPGGPLS